MAKLTDHIRTVSCCGSCDYSRGYEGTEWCVKHQITVYDYHVCDDHECRMKLSKCGDIQSFLSNMFSLRRWNEGYRHLAESELMEIVRQKVRGRVSKDRYEYMLDIEADVRLYD